MRSAAASMPRSARIIAANETALIAKHGATPANAITMPASAGPIVRAPLSSAAPRLTALTSRSGPTSSTRNAWRAGLSTALTAPRAKISP